MPKIYPVIMSGGAGTRLWPLSRKKSPKQYHAMVAEQTMFAQTLLRMRDSGDNDVAAPIIICADGHQDLIKAQAASLDMPLTAIILEPAPRNTAAVGAVAARFVDAIDKDGLILLLPADHHIEDTAAFWGAISKAASVAKNGYLMTLGIEPTGPETGFGYIQRGDALASDVYKIAAFKEKPELELAKSYLTEGTYSWNAGIFLFSTQRLLAEYKTHAADILKDSTAALENANIDGIVQTLSLPHFSKCRSAPIDIAIMEQTQFAGVVAPVRVGWNDIGSWAAISDFAAGQNDMKMTRGDALLVDCEDTYARSDGPFVAAIGVKDLVIIATPDSVLVAHKDATQDVKKVVEHLKSTGRDDLL